MNLNKSFAQAVAAVTRPVSLTHTQQITRMYRKSLRLVESWAMDRAIFNAEATKIRQQFEANKGLDPSSGKCARIVRETSEKLAAFTHPDPYCAPYMPGGSKFMRNPPLPFETVFPDGIPEEVAHVVPKDVNYIQVPKSASPEGMETVIVDFYKKNAE